MTSTNFDQHSQTHEFVWENLPWYVNGTLDVEQQRIVETHLRDCLICRRELLALQALARAVKRRVKDPECEMALAKLHDRIDSKTNSGNTIWASAASLFLMVGLVIAASNRVTDGLGDFSAGYQTLGNEPAVGSYPSARSARVVFRPNVNSKEMVRLLDGVDASIANGPSRRGAYTVNFSETLSSKDQLGAIRSLRDSGRVLFVEPTAAALNDNFYRN
ncbi:MAG: hypothetical protein AAF387_08680 [Pseudomonadota bacterium]